MSVGQVRSLWGRVLTDGQALPPHRVEIVEGRIARLMPTDEPDQEDLVVDDGWLVPGFIDLQVNGAGGVDLTGSTDLQAVARVLPRHGVTAFCPTVISSAPAHILDRLRAYRARPVAGGATSLGPHLEGPFLNPRYRGVHEERSLRPPSRQEIEAWLDAGPPRLVTLAPELPGGLQAIEQLAAAGVTVSLGHSGASDAIAQAALQAGARLATHLFNAMAPLHHRQPGLIGALLASQATLGLIADGVHVDPLLVDLVVRRAGPGRVALVSDAAAAAAAPHPGASRLGQREVWSDGQAVRAADGTLAGGLVLLDEILRRVRAWLPDLSPAQAVQMVTATPARALGLTERGRLAEGLPADVVVLSPAFEVRQTLVGGQPCFTDVDRASRAASRPGR